MTHMSQRLMLTALRSARLNGVPFEEEVNGKVSERNVTLNLRDTTEREGPTMDGILAKGELSHSDYNSKRQVFYY